MPAVTDVEISLYILAGFGGVDFSRMMQGDGVFAIETVAPNPFILVR